MRKFIEAYNGEVDRYRRTGGNVDIDDFVNYDKVKWSRNLKLELKRANYAEFAESKVRISLYRPFCKRHLFFDRVLNEEVYVFPRISPTVVTESENRIIALTGPASEKPFLIQIVSGIADLHLVGAGSSTQCFPLYIYDEDGGNRRENITDWALGQFRAHYDDETITKSDIFHYVYGLLHHPDYREKYADNLKRDLPRIPFAPDFRAFAAAGERLAELHLNYEEAEPYELKWRIEEGAKTADLYRVEKMRLNKGKDVVRVNDCLQLAGIPQEAYDYRLGNRSALEWVIDQYRVRTYKRSGITSDPNNPDDPEYIVRLVGRVITVSVETVKAVEGLPEDFGG